MPAIESGVNLSYVLLGTDGCHLCEEAATVVTQGAQGLDVTVYIDDIVNIENGVDIYGLRIPVFRHEISGEELDWPFTTNDVRQLFLKNEKGENS